MTRFQRKSKSHFKQAWIVLALCLMLTLAGCGQDQAPWVAQDSAQANLQAFTVDLTQDSVHHANYTTVSKDGQKISRNYSPDRGLNVYADEQSGTGDLSALTLGQMPQLVQNLMDQLPEGFAGADEYSISINRPGAAFSQAFPQAQASYALSDGKVTPVTGQYEGSRDYGMASIAARFGQQAQNWYVAITD